MSPTMGKPAAYECALFVALSGSVLDILSEWATFSTCRQPVHKWLLASYALLLIFRVVHSIGCQTSTSTNNIEGEFLVNLRIKGTAPKLLQCVTWFLVMPGFSIWTTAGTYWVWDVTTHSPDCMPPNFLRFTVFWQIVSYAWIVTHLVIGCVAVSAEWKLRSHAADLRALEDPETLERWGNVSQNQSESAMSERIARRCTRSGLSPKEIAALGGIAQVPVYAADEECSVCLADLQVGDTLRSLPNCVHSFHRSCIDLWLLQSSTCPLCKVEVPRPCHEGCTKRIGAGFWGWF